MRLKRALHSSVAAICIAAVSAPAGLAAPVRAAPREALDVRVGEAREFSRIELNWVGGAKSSVRRNGQILTLSFNRDANPDLARLRVDPPRWLKAAEARHSGGRLSLVLTLADDAEAKVGTADGATYVNLFQRPEPEVAPPVAAPVVAEREPERPNPIPHGGVVHMDASLAGGQVLLTFPWANPSGAAVFRRGGAIWAVFDASATLDVSRAPRGLKQFSSVQAFRGADYAAVRISAPTGVPFFASSQAGVWTIAIGPGTHTQAAQIKITRDDVGGPATLKAAVAGATRTVKFVDPAVGDTLTVVTALGPAKGVPTRREYVQMAVLPSAQGLAMESFIEDLTVSHDGDLVHIGRPAGLALSPASAGVQREDAQLGAPKAASRPALIDPTWGATAKGGFLARYNNLLNFAMAEAQKGKDAPVVARMALARFLVGSELSYEAIGVLNGLGRTNPDSVDDPEFRGLRGIARVMARRYKEAQADFSSPVLSEDPSAALWRSYVATQLAQWPETRTQFTTGAEAFNQFSPLWKARFARSDAQAALALGDLEGADHSVKLAFMDKTDPLEELATRLVEARVIEMSGHPDRALRIYAAVSLAPTESLSSPALLRATQIRLQMGKLTPLQAAAVFDGLRYRWRGDATELETIRALGQLYLGQGHYREALEALRSAGKRLPDLPEALQLQADLGAAFRSLFLEGAADGLEPIQALALFYDFKELTPLGADGDLMVRKLVRRLVDVDLLDQAADFLKYQADNRLDGVPRAQVSTDVAVIYLMDRKPELALQAINDSRTTILPPALNAERRLVEGRALMNLGRLDAALEVIERDTTREGQDLRGEVAWKQKNWSVAGAIFEKSLADRWKRPGPLGSDEEGKLLRVGVAYSLANDDGALARVRDRYQGFFEDAHNPDALRVALLGVEAGQVNIADFSRVTADNEAFAGWVAKMKQRFKQRPAPMGPVQQAINTPAAPQKQAAATPTSRPTKG